MMIYEQHVELESVSSVSVGSSTGGRSRGMEDDDPEDDQSAATDLLGMLRLPQPLISCCDTLLFSLLTFFFLLDVLSSLGLIILYVVNYERIGDEHVGVGFLTVSVTVFSLASLLTSIMYATQMRRQRHTEEGIGGSGKRVCTLLGCLVLNIPLQVGILAHQMRMMARRCASCSCSSCSCCCVTETPYYPSAFDFQDMGSRKQKIDSNLWWVFIKLNLIHAVVNSCPQMVLTVLFLFWYEELHIIQYISIASSFILLVLSSVMHEKLRKERARNSPYGCLPMLCIILYRSFVFSARIIAFAVFFLYFGLLICVVIIPHFVVMVVFFTYLYRQVWKVPYWKIITNSVYCVLAYFPIHCEYRPEGEIVLYYIIYLLENIVMVGLAYAQEPFLPYTDQQKPWSDFHKTATALVLLFSSIGLMFMGTYYFFFHGANETISDTSLGWLAKVFEWTKRTNRSGHRVGFYSVPASTQSSFSNPLYLENPPLIAQPSQPIRENVTSPLWGEPPCHHHSLYRHREDRNATSNGSLFSSTTRVSNTNKPTADHVDGAQAAVAAS